MGDYNSIVEELKKAFKDIGIPEMSVADNETTPSADSKPESTPACAKTDASSFDIEKINDIIYFEKQVVEPERLNAIRASISKWSNSIPNHNLTNLGEKIQIVTVYDRPSYLITLKTQYETRELQKGLKSYTGEDIPSKSVTEDSIDIWAYEVPLSDGFADEKNSYNITGSAEVFECSNCDGQGTVVCNNCDGARIVTCPKCSGDGEIKCSECKGSGEIKCSECKGKGETRCPIWGGCGGTGYTGSGNNRRTCSFCKGHGSIPCNSCRKRGYKRCTSCKNGFNVCRRCEGKRVVRCNKCNASGILTCSRCDGYKEIIKYLYFDDILKTGLTVNMIKHSEVPFKLTDRDDIKIIIKEGENEDEKIGKEVELGKIVEKGKDNETVEDDDDDEENDQEKEEKEENLAESLLKGSPAVEILQKEIPENLFQSLTHETLKEAISELIKSAKSSNDSTRIIKQEVKIYKVNAITVNYAHLNKQYSLLLYGNNYEKVYTKVNPIFEIVDNCIALAKNLYIEKNYSQALEEIERAIKILPDREEAKGLKKQTINRINGEYTIGGITGGLITAMILGLVTWWDMLRVSVFLFIGFITGFTVSTIFAENVSIKIKENKKRILYPLFLSIIGTIGMFFLFNTTIWKADSKPSNSGGIAEKTANDKVLKEKSNKKTETKENAKKETSVVQNDSAVALTAEKAKRKVVAAFEEKRKREEEAERKAVEEPREERRRAFVFYDLTVLDKKTNLMWTRDANIAGKEMEWKDAFEFIKLLNEQKYAGYSNWRLPTKKELMTLVDFAESQGYKKSLDDLFNKMGFENVQSYYYWSSTTYADATGAAWFVNMYDGNVSYNFKASVYYVLPVRAGQVEESRTKENIKKETSVVQDVKPQSQKNRTEKASKFNDNGDGTVTDNAIKLMWQQGENDEKMDWDSAIAYCGNLSLAGYNDWRLPNRDELKSIVDETKRNPAIDTTYFPNTNSSSYWSSTTNHAHYSSYAWLVYFDYGYVDDGVKSYYDCYVRCVRGGQ